MKLKPYKKYKDSGIPWIGEIPEHWEVKKLKYLSKINSDVLSEKTEEEFEFIYIDISSVDSNGKLSDFKLIKFKDSPSRARRLVKYGDTIVSTVRTYLKAITFIDRKEENLICSTGFAVIQPNKKYFFPKYIYYMFCTQKIIDLISSLSRGVSYPAIDSEEIKNIMVLKPPIEEQKMISNFLDRKTSQVDDLISKKKRLIELLEEEKTAIINQAVTKGIDPNAPMKDSGIPWIGEIPEHWEIKKLKYCANIKYGLGEPPKQKENGLPLIRATNITRGKIVEKDMIFVDPEYIPYDRDPILKVNDIIVVRSGAYTADSAIIPKKYEGAITGYDMVVRSIVENPIFISYCLLSDYILKNQLYLLKLRAAQPHLNREDLGETLIIIPRKTEQDKIVKYIQKHIDKIEYTNSKIEKEIILLNEYRTSLISEAVTGKIDVRNES